MAFFGENSCDAWINFVGTSTVSIRDSFNVAGLQDNSTGDYTVLWDTDFPDSNYCALAGAGGTTGIPTTKLAVSGTTYATDGIRVATLSIAGNGGSMDNNTVTVAAWGDT